MQKEQADAQDLILDELSKLTSHITQTADANSEIINATLEQHMKQLSGIKQSVNSHIEQSETNLSARLEQLQTDTHINQRTQERTLHEIDSLFTMLKSIWMNELSGYMETLAGNHTDESRFYRYRYVTCPVCHARCQISGGNQETEIRCPQCGTEFYVAASE